MKSPERALKTLDQVLRANPQAAELRFKIAMVYFWLQMPEAAAEQARIAVSLSPKLTLLWVLLGDMLSLSGDLDGACAAFDKALALDPHAGGALAGLLQSGRPVDLQDIAERADIRAHDESASTVSRIAAAFALGDARHKSKSYDEAFAAYALGKRLVRESRFEPDAGRVLSDLQKMLDWTRESFTEDTFLTGPSLGNLSNVPVFIVGMPRSGTSLIEQILASHPSVVGVGEASDIPDTLGMNQPLLHPNNWDVAEMQRRTSALVARHAANYPTALRVVDKMPDNVKVLGQIALMFPRSQVIVSRRDLRDVCWSCLTQNFSEADMIWADTQEECAARARLIEQFIDHWLEVLPVSILEVNYEEMVADLEGQSRRLIDFIGLPWDQNCLEFYKTARTVKTASAWQVRKPLYSSSVGRWRPYREHLGPLLEGLKGLVPEGD
jgi:tetratricopeptide (TPR) repeat protein